MIVSIAGTDVHVDGDEAASAIVMVHGWPDTYRLWDAQVEFLKAGYRCIRFTLPGFDETRPRRAYTVDEVTGLLRQVIVHLSPGRRVTLMLHDWGCIYGYEFYMRHPELVARIVGVDIGDVRGLRQALGAREKLYILAYQVWLALAWKIGGRLGDWMTRRMARWVRARSDPRFVSSRMNYPYYLTWFGGSQSFGRQTRRFQPSCPMLFIYGERKLFMFHASDWVEALNRRPGSKAVGFDTGHWVMLQRAERFNQVAGEWLAGAP
ncbi:MAG TPA: alpha/beta fold hydrolase [Burkholderiales bacterium]|nr:alpha/beta fold hydrolase [Burkholderiales bacterium]